MTNESNELNPNEDVSSVNENSLDNIDTSSTKSEGFSSFIENVKEGNITGNAPIAGDIPPVRSSTSKPTEVKAGEDPLLNAGKFVQGQVETGKENNLHINLDDYAPYFGNNIGYIPDVKTLDSARASNQTKVEQFRNAAARVALNVVPETISQLANIIDFEDYYNSDAEVGNWLTNALQKVEGAVDKATPIYRENPDKPLDYGDSGWWFENGSGLVKSAAAFVATGYITGGVIGPLFSKAGQASKWLATAGETAELGAQGKKILGGVTTVAEALALNQAEGVGIGVDTYNQVYNQQLQNIKADKKSLNMSNEAIEKEARLKASEAASSAINFNRLNILFNLTSSAMFLETPMTTRNIIKKDGIGKGLMHLGIEGVQEGVEEGINDISQNQAIAESNKEDYTFKDAMKYAFSQKGLESELLGFIGGIGQTALTKAGKYIPMYKNTGYNKAYMDAYFQTSSDLSEAERTAEASRIALQKTGTDSKRVSSKFLENKAYVDQQSILNEYNTLSTSDKVSDMTNAFATAEDNITLLNEINKAKKENNTALSDSLQKRLLSNQMLQAFQGGTTEHLINTYKALGQLSNEDAAAKGLYKEGDEITPNYFKTKANEVVKDIATLEKVYTESGKYVNSDEVFNLEAHKYEINKAITNNVKAIKDEFNKAEELYKDDKSKHPSFKGSYIDGESVTGYNIDKVTPAFRSTPSYKKIKELTNADKTLRQSKNDLQSVLDHITDKGYQSSLTNAIVKHRASKQAEVKRRSVKEKIVESKNKVTQKVKDLKQSITNDEVNEVDTSNIETSSVVETGKEDLPVVENEVEDIVVDDKPKTTSNVPVFVDFPTSSVPHLSNMYSELKRVAEDVTIPFEEKLPFLETGLDKLSRKEDILSIFPLEGNSIDSAYKALDTAVTQLKSQQQGIEFKNQQLASLQQDFVDTLTEDIENPNNVDTNEAPNSKPDFNKVQERVSKLISILELLDELGTDMNDFKAVVKSFEDNISKQEVSKIFDTLKYLYNVATDNKIEGSYEDIMLSTKEKQAIVTHNNKVLKYNKDSDTYTSDMDNISEDIITSYRDIAKLNNIESESNALGFDIYNETASNKIAYLSKLYGNKFSLQKSREGNEYIEVTKEDINNLLNSSLDQRFLQKDFIKVGDTIKFVPLQQVTLENGNIRNNQGHDVDENGNIVKEGNRIDNAPIGIELNGELIAGTYVHDTTWLNISNLNNSKEGVEEDQNISRKLRKLILDGDQEVITTIINKSPGVPILDASGEVNSVLNNTPDVDIAISKDGLYYSNRDVVINTVNIAPIPEGKGVIIIPFGKDKLALPVKRSKLNTDQINSIISATSLYLEGNKTEVTDNIDKQYDINILTSRGLEQYINQFIHLSTLPANNVQEFNSALVDIADNVNLVQFSNGQLLYGSGQQIGVNNISKSKNKGEERQKDLEHFKQHLKTIYTHVNLDLLKDNKPVVYIIGDKLFQLYNDYKEFSKANMISPYLGIKLDNGETIYTVQSKIHFDMDSIFNPNKKPNLINAEIKGNQEVAVKSNDIRLPDGRVFNFDDVTDDDFSPIIDLSPNTDLSEQDINELIDSSTLIKGLSITTQSSLVKSIANDIFIELMDNKNNSDYVGDLGKQLKLSIEVLDFIKEKASIQMPSKVDFIAKQIEIIKANQTKIARGVKIELNKRGVQVKEGKVKIVSQEENEINSVNDSNNELGEVSTYEDINDRSIWDDVIKYTIDPRTTLSQGVKQFLEGVKEKNVKIEIKKETNSLGKEVEVEYKTYKDRVNYLGLNNYIGFDVIFNDLLSILGKSNNEPFVVEENNKLDEQYGNVPSYIVKAIKLIENQLDNKPYLIDVINKLKEANLQEQNAFILALNKTHTNHIYAQATYNKENENYSLRINKASSRGVNSLILSEWQNNLETASTISKKGGEKAINKEGFNAFINTYEDIKKGNVVFTYELVNTWLNSIGVDIPKEVYNQLNKGIKFDNRIYSLSDQFLLPKGIFKNIYDRVNKFNPNKTNALLLDTNSILEDNAFKQLANLVSKTKKNLFTDSFKNGNGDTVYGWSNNKYVTDRALDLKSNLNLVLNLKNDLFANSSTWLNDLTLEDENGVVINKNSLFYKYFEYGTSDSLKIREDVLGKTIDSLSKSELEKYHLSLFFNKGLQVGKGSTGTPIMRVVYPTMSDKSNTFILQVPGKKYTLNTDGKLRDSDLNELVKVLILPEIERIKVHNANPNKYDIKEWKNGGGKFLMLPDLNNTTSLFEEDGTLKADVGISNEFNEILKSELKKILNVELQEKLSNWRKYDLIKTAPNGVEYFQFIDKDYAYNNGNNAIEIGLSFVLNNMVANMNIQQLFAGDIALYTKGDAYGTADNLGKRLAGHNAGFNQFIYQSGDSFNVLVIKDNLEDSNTLPYKIKLLGEEGAKDYKDINTADAQEYVTLEEHLNNEVGEGKLERVVADRILKTYNTTGVVTDKDIKLILQPKKPLYYNTFNRNGLNAPLYIKSSALPLVKSLTEGTPLDVLRQFMEDNNVHRVAHESAVKLGSPSQLVNIYKDGNITIPKDWKKSFIQNVPRQGHGIQNEVPYDADKSIVNDGTQQAKLLFTNLLEVNDFVHPETKEKVTGRELEADYRDTYKQLFKNKYDKLIETLGFNKRNNNIFHLKKLQRILIDEGLSRNYSSNDIAGLELKDGDTNFSVDLWLNNSESKIGSLLNSIVDNRVRKRKFRGKSFVLASESGTQLKTLNEINKSEITKVGNWDGTLRSQYNKDGQMTYAEVLVPFKMWDNKGKALKLDTFLNEDGTIDLTRLPEELLEIIGYRIPTSGVNLISTIKVVGFLPSNYGDVVIAPKDFIVQMGSDFDVDKLYTHMYNTHYNTTTKTLSIINKDTLASRQSIENGIKRLKESKTLLLKQENKSEEDINNISDINNRVNILNSSDLLALSDLEDMVLQNKLLDIHKAVLNNPDEQVQRARVKPLSFGHLPNLAKIIYSNKVKKGFTVLANSYQQFKYSSARAGKTAVGIFSLDMVFNTALQVVEEDLHFVNSDEERIKFTIGGFTSNALNSVRTVDNKRNKSEVLEGFMTAALDNEKEQLLHKLNINNNTFDFIRAATQLGFTEDITLAIINQPIIFDYIEKKEFNKPIDEVTFSQEYKNLLASTSLKELLESTQTKKIDTELQKAVISLFYELSSKGKELKEVQSAINSDSSGVGKNLFYSMMKAEQVVKVLTQPSIPGINKVIGEVVNIPYNTFKTEQEAVDYIKAKEKDGFILYKGILINPQTIGGFAGVYATLFNTQLWSSLYPYADERFNTIVQGIMPGKVDSKQSVNEKANELQKSISNYKSLLISNTYQLTSNYVTIYDARKDLLFDTEEHKSLGSILYELKSKNIYSNQLLDRLQIGKSNIAIDTSGKLPTDINYYNATTLEMDEEILLNSFVDMLINDNEIGEYNGELLTTRKLADKLITHQIITGGLQKSNQFIKYIPFKYLQKLGYYDNLKQLTEQSKVYENVNAFRDIYRTQYIQHFPESYYTKENEKLKDIIKDGVLYIKPEYHESAPKIIVLEGGRDYRIFKLNQTNDYQEIDRLGWKGMAEYDFNSPFAGKSNIYVNTGSYNAINILNQEAKESGIAGEYIEYEDLGNNTYVPPVSETSNFLRLDRDTTKDNSPTVYNTSINNVVKRYYLDDNSLSVEDKYRLILDEISKNNTNPVLVYFANKLKEVAGYLAETPLYIDTNLKAKGQSRSSKILGQPIQIRINPNNITSETEMQEVLIEEMTHALLKSQLNDETNGFTRNIKSIMGEVKDMLMKKYPGKYEEMENKIKNNLPLREGVERDLMYSVYNVDEFVAAAIKNKTFQQLLNTTEATHIQKSLWEKFISAIKDLLVKLGVTPDKNLEAVLHETINLFDKVKESLYSELQTPKYIRTVEYLNDKFKLVDELNSPIAKGNAQQIAEFINRNIVNIKAKVNGEYVELESETLKDFVKSYSPNFISDEELNESTIGGNLKNYIDSLNIRVKKLRDSIKKAKDSENYERASNLQDTLDKELEGIKELKDVSSLVGLADKAKQDLELIDNILSRPMNAEDIVYARHTINFWKRAKEMIFDERANSSEPLAKLYGGIEAVAEQKSNKLFKIEKDYIENWIKDSLGKDTNLDNVFEKYKDINYLQGKVRDISSYDNVLLTTIWNSVKQANINATDEVNKLLDNLDEQTKQVVPILTSINKQDPFGIFAQVTSRGKRTNHLVNPYTSDFYKEKSKQIELLKNSNDHPNLMKFTSWLRENAIDTRIIKIFPIDEKVTSEIEANREALKKELGEHVYNHWFKSQQKRLDSYNKHKQGELNKLKEKFNLLTIDDVLSEPDAKKAFDFWVTRNSPYALEDYTFSGKKIGKGIENFNNSNYYEVLPKDSKYYDDNYRTISNNPTLLNYYNTIDNVFNELRKYVPDHQQKSLAYGGIPAIEKSLFELYSDKGLKELGFTPIRDAWTKSMQSSFSDKSYANIDPVTGKAINQMNIPIIKDTYNEVQKYIQIETAKYVTEFKKEPSIEKINEFREDAIDLISKANSFDLSKIAKVYASLTLAHKHKAQIEDTIKVANTILDSYKEKETRPDGTPILNKDNIVQYKDTSTSFLKTKEALDYYTNNILYGDVKDEEGKGKTTLTKSEQVQKDKINDLLFKLEVDYTNNTITKDIYENNKLDLTKQLNSLGKTFVYSKAGDNVLKYVQLKLMGWNVLGGISNMGFGYISNVLEAAGGQLFTKKDLAYAYKVTTNSMLKNASFNKVENETAKKIRSVMSNWDILKDASHELFTSSTAGSLHNGSKWLSPYNMNQRTEYVNQAPLMIALAMNTKINTDKGDINLWEALDNDGNWKTEYGEEPKEIITKFRVKLDQLIKRTHGNYDNLSPLAVKKNFLGRAGSQFRTWLYESIATRIEDERYDDILETTVKGRYRSVGTVFQNTDKLSFATETLKGILKQWSFGVLFKNADFTNLVEGNVKDIDAVNMRKVAMEVSMAINLYMFLLALSAIGGDDDDKEWANILFNQGARLKTDLLLYVNPNEARNIIKDIIPAMSVVKDSSDWLSSVGKLAIGKDELESGVHEGDSRLFNSTIKMIPFGSKAFSLYNNAEQRFNK